MNFFKKIPLKTWVIVLLFSFVALVSLLRILESYELPLYDSRLRWRLIQPQESSEIIIVEIGDDEIKAIGRWPWDRDYHASLVDVLTEYGVKAIVFDMIFGEPHLTDDIFIESIYNSGRVYFGRAFYLEEQRRKRQFFIESVGISGDVLESYQDHLRGWGHININPFADLDGKVRRVPPFIKHQNELQPLLSLKVAADSLGLDTEALRLGRRKLIIDESLSLPLTDKGSLIVNYPGLWKDSFTHVSYGQLLASYVALQKGKEPSFDLTQLKDKVCFVGLTSAGSPYDIKPTPFEGRAPMLMLQASVYNSLITGQFIYDVGTLINTLINLMIFGLILFIGLRFPLLRSWVLVFSIAMGYVVISHILLSYFGVWVDLFLPLCLLIITYLGASTYQIIDQTRKRELLEKELDIARQIQQSFLPNDVEKISGIDIFPFMQPAKVVGGDLYDIIHLANNRVGIFIGDVSGKGVPASLIMAQTISLLRIFAKQHDDPAAVLTQLNEELCKVLQGRFVTALYVIVDANNHCLQGACAGHNPLIFYDAQQNSVEDFLPESGLPLGILDIAGYENFKRPLCEGDKFILYTDGITEARDKKGNEFGQDRLRGFLEKDKADSGGQIVESLKDEIFNFSRGLPQFDDITLIILAAVRP